MSGTSIRPPPLPSRSGAVAAKSASSTVSVAESLPEFVNVTVSRENDTDVPVKLKTSAVLSKMFTMYAEFKRLDVNRVLFFTGSPPVELSGDDTPAKCGLKDGSVIVAALFQPFCPEHSEYCDLAFTVDGYVFKAHKYPMLRSGSGLIESLLDMATPGEPLPLDVPGGARVFDIVSRFCHSERPAEDISRLLNPANFVNVRVAASYLQMDKFAAAADAWLDKAVLPVLPKTLFVLQCALTVDAAQLQENNIVGRCVAAAALLLDWSDADAVETALQLPPAVFADMIVAAEGLKTPRVELAQAVMVFLERQLRVGPHTRTDADPAPGRQSPSFSIVDGALAVTSDVRTSDTGGQGPVFDVLSRLQHLIDPSTLTAAQGLVLLRALQSSSDSVLVHAQQWLDALTGRAGDVGDAAPDSGLDALQLCVLVLSTHFTDLIDVPLPWMPAPLLALIVRQASAAGLVKRHVLSAYMLARSVEIAAEPGVSSDASDAGSAKQYPITFEDLQQLLVGTAPHSTRQGVQANSDAGDAKTSAAPSPSNVTRDEDDDDVIGMGNIAEFYCVAFQAVVWLFSQGSVGLEDRERMLLSLRDAGALPLELLPAHVLSQSVATASMPRGVFVEAIVAQNALLQQQTLDARRDLRRLQSSDARSRLCRESHVPVGTRLAVKRSKGEFACGTVRYYSPDTGMHCVMYGPDDKRWYNLSKTVYEVMGMESSSGEEEEEESDEEDEDEDD